MRPAFLVMSIAASIALISPFARAQSDNDGAWAVSLLTHKGDCDRSINSSVRVRDGRIEEQSLFARITGAIDPTGTVSLKVVRGSDTIAARGMVTGLQARGSWTAPSRNCSGSWIAMRG